MDRRCIRCGGSNVPPGLVAHDTCPRPELFQSFKSAWDRSGWGRDLKVLREWAEKFLEETKET